MRVQLEAVKPESGGGGSLLRTRLRLEFSANREKNKESGESWPYSALMDA